VQPAAATYRVGATPVVRLIAQNVSATTCTRDLGAAQQEILLYAGTTRLWSSNDCYSDDSHEARVLRPGERVDYEVTWARRTSAPGCPAGRDAVRPGDYLLVARLGGLTSVPVLFRLE
jgi:hypothetical protein